MLGSGFRKVRRPQPGELHPSSQLQAPVPLHFGEYQHGVGKGVTIPRPHGRQPRPRGRAVCSRGCVSAQRGGADGKTHAPDPVVNTRLHNSHRRCEGRGAWRVGQSPVYPAGRGFPRGADGSLPPVALPAEPPGSWVPPGARCPGKPLSSTPKPCPRPFPHAVSLSAAPAWRWWCWSGEGGEAGCCSPALDACVPPGSFLPAASEAAQPSGKCFAITFFRESQQLTALVLRN